MSYLSAKKIYPGNFTEALNGWYKNIDTNDSGSNDKSVGGPTSVLAIPGQPSTPSWLNADSLLI